MHLGMLRWIVVVHLATFGIAETATSYCCTDRYEIETDGKCPNETENISSKLCPDVGAFILFPEDEESYDIDSSTGELILDDSKKIPKEEYCLVQTKIGNVAKTMAFVCLFMIPEANTNVMGMTAMVVCSFISIFFLIITLVVYGILPELRDLQGKCMVSMMFSLLMAFTALVAVQFKSVVSEGTCIFLALFLYFWFLSVFFWLNVVSFNVWQSTIRPTWFRNKECLFQYYNAYGWGAPIIMLLVTLICHTVPGKHIKPFALGRCWFSGRQEIWAYFYGPISILILANIVMFILTAKELWRSNQNCQQQQFRSHKFKFLLYLKLFIVMGICWTFEPLSMVLEGVNFWLITDYVNVLQGVLIFFLLVVFRKRVRRGLVRRGVCCFKSFSSWNAISDDECEELEDEEGATMNNTDNERGEITQVRS